MEAHLEYHNYMNLKPLPEQSHQPRDLTIRKNAQINLLTVLAKSLNTIQDWNIDRDDF